MLESASFPERVEILSGGKRFLLQHATFTDLGSGQWQVEFNVAAQPDTMALVSVVRG